MTLNNCNFLNYLSNVKGSVWHKFFKERLQKYKTKNSNTNVI